ncbi:type II toxin-antitoxin system VapC family toxin [Halosimplex pelagicum]|uniref:Type II toxin-antitoxin system VapC family toxin n=1 Tax=Halosimplex pelagicum TaxID=869886 RepID=A0A7D5PDR5_9EURY|nr:type II toxin-antitoxin system VapC family toxin [Halosimplex pelagicum]QLH81300.1 type II toxin-antitoxin system VapC family toxin [Halosimplex pelagicum]
MICLDNDIFSRYASKQAYPSVDRFLTNHAEEPWILPSIVLFEYLKRYDSHNTIERQRRNAEQSVDAVADLSADITMEGANLRARLATADTTLDLADLLIAATAREYGATLATANKNDFDKQAIHELVDVDIVEVVR